MLTHLLTNPIAVAEGDPQDIQGDLYPEEILAIQRAAEIRRQEFVTGRLLARQALVKFAVDRFPLKVGKNREPLWPDGLIGSITHTLGFCAVAVGRRQDIGGLGIDVERMDRVQEEIWLTVCTPAELHFLQYLPECKRQSYAALFFSAKESFYKCQYPLTQKWIEFQDVTIQTMAEKERFVVQVNQDLFEKETVIEGRYCFDKSYVATAIILPL